MGNSSRASIVAILIIIFTFYWSGDCLELKPLRDFTRQSKSMFELLYPVGSIQSSSESENSNQVCYINEGQNLIIKINHRSCSWQQNICQQTLNQITRVDFDANVLSPGSLFRVNNPTTFSKGIIQEYVSKDYKNPLTIRLFNGLETVFSGFTQPAQFRQNLNAFLSKNLPYLNDQPVELAIAEQNGIEKMMETLGLSSAIYQELNIARSKKDPVTIAKKVVIVLHQKFFTASLDLPRKGNLTDSSLTKLFFRNTTPQESYRIKNLIYDPETPLQYISRTNYGRLLVLSLTDNNRTQNQIDRLYNCIVLDNINHTCFNAVMKDIHFNPTLRYYFAGVDESLPYEENERCSYCKNLINWERVFFPLNASSVQSLRPLSAQATNFKKQQYNQLAYRFFETLNCKKSISIDFKYISEGVTISVLYTRRSVYSRFAPNDQFKKSVKKHLFNATHPGTFQIGSQVGKEVFQLKFIAKGKRISNGLKFFFLKNKPLYSIQVQFALLINGEKKIGHVIGQSRSQNQFKEITIRVDPETFSGNVIFVDE